MSNRDQDRIRLLERTERDAWELLCRAAPSGVAHDIGLQVHRFGEVLLTIATRIDQGQFNRLFGFGLDGKVDAVCIGEAVQRFRSSRLRNPYIQIPPGQPLCDAMAESAGLVPYKRSWVKFQRGTDQPPHPVTGVEISLVGIESASLFGSVIAAGFGMPPPMAEWLSALVGRPRWRCYVAWDSGEAISGAALYLGDHAAWLGAGATRAEARRRGAQTALIARRIADAGDAGLAIASTETGKPLPGEVHPSYANIVRSGFTATYERANWTFPPEG